MPLESKHRPEGDQPVAERQMASAAPVRQFVGREEFTAPVHTALKGPPRAKPLVLVYHGGAGIGKSRLRRELVRQLARGPGVLTATLDFDVTGHRDPETALLFLRRTLHETYEVRFPSFDLAYAVFWQKTHPDTALASGDMTGIAAIPDRVPKEAPESLLSQLLDESGKLPLRGLIPKITKLVRVQGIEGSRDRENERSRDQVIKDWWERRGERELEDLPDTEPGAIVDRLPKLWAADLRDYLGATSLMPHATSHEDLKSEGKSQEPKAKSGHNGTSQVHNDAPSDGGRLGQRGTMNEERTARRAVLFIDSYEKLWDIGRTEADFFKRDEWVRELITQLPEALWVVCGRQKLRWEEVEKDWGNALSQHELRALPEKSARKFLESCDITSGQIQDAIVKGSQGVPHYLDLAVDAVQNANCKLQNANLTGGSPDELVAEFTRHLDRPEVETLKVLSAARFWYYGLFEHLITEYQTGYPPAAYDDLSRFSFIKDGAAPGTRTMHELMREALQENQPPELRKSVHRFLFQFYAKQVEGMKESNITEQHRAALLEAFYHGRQAMGAEELWPALMDPTMVFYDAEQHRLLRPIYQEMAERLEAELGPSHICVGQALVRLGITVRMQAEYAAAEPLLRRALAIVENERGTENWFFVECLNDLAKLLIRQDRLGEAEALYRRAVEVFDKPGQTPIFRNTALNGLSCVLFAKGRLDECEELIRRSLALCEEEIGPDKYETALALTNLSTLLNRRSRFSEAEPLARRALEINEKGLGPNHVDVAWALKNLAVTLVHLGRYTEAEPQLRRTLKIKQEALGPDHDDTAVTMNSLSALLHDLGRYGEADTLVRRALPVLEERLGPDNPATLTAAANLSIFLTKQGRYDEAEQLALDAVARCEEKLGPGHPVTAAVLYAAGLARSRQGRHAEAENFLARAVEIDTKVHGPENTSTLRSLDELAVLAERQSRYAEAESLLRDILGKRERVQGPEHPHFATTAYRLAGICCRDGRYAEAETLYRRALAIREKIFGPDHIFTAETLEGVAKACEQTGRAAEAQELTARAQRIRAQGESASANPQQHT